MLAVTQTQQLETDSWIGREVPRVEDLRLVTGAGRFVDDIAPEGCLHLEFVRSAHPRGRIVGIDLSAALEAPGVVAVYTAADIAELGSLSVNPLLPGIRVPRFAVLAQETVEAVGQPVVAVVATSVAEARDAAQFVSFEVDAAPLRAGTAEDSAFSQIVRAGDVEAAFARAAHVARVRVEHARLAPMPLEPRAALASWSEAEAVLTVWLSTQTPHRAREDLMRMLGLAAGQVRVIAPDVGGAFGGKASIYPEDVMVAWAARALGRPVKWCALRSEDLLAATQGRGAILEGEMAVAGDGRALGLRARLTFPLGHWLPYSAAAPGRNAARILPGPYRIDAIDIDLHGRMANTAAVGIYRGAGRPEAAMLMERLMDEAARLLRLDPAEIRRRNLIGPGEFPFATPTGETLDSGNYPALLAKARARFDYDRVRAGVRARRRSGDVCGIGIGLYIEPCGQGWESASLTLAVDGRIVAATGSTAQGQGRETATAQIVAEALNVPLESVVVKQGDTAETPNGIGALASRSTAIGGSAMLRAAEAFKEKARRQAARLLKCSPAHLALTGAGFIALEGSGRSVAWSRLATGAGEAEALSASVVYHAEGEAWSSGCCIALVAIDRDTGVPTVEKLTWIDDAGVVLNPMLVRSQLIGGMAQGVGEALMERVVYDESGQLVTGSFMDYALPRASDIPAVDIDTMVTPSPANALGAKGVGEAGCIGIPAAIVNAAVEALRPFGISHLDMPLTSQKLWKAMQARPSPPDGSATP